MRTAAQLAIPLAVLAAVLAWAVTREGQVDLLAEREEIFEGGAVVEPVPQVDGTEPPEDSFAVVDRGFRWVLLDDGRWVVFVPSPPDADGPAYVAGRAATGSVRQLRPGCVIELGSNPVAPPPVLRTLPDDHEFDEDDQTVSYWAPETIDVNVTEDLSRLEDEDVIPISTGNGTMRLRPATEEELDATRAVVDAPRSPTTTVSMRVRDVSQEGPPLLRTFTAAEDCPEVLVSSVGPELELALAPGEPAVVPEAVALDSALTASSSDLLGEMLAGEQGELPLAPGERFGVRVDGIWLLAYEVVTCEPAEWFPCRPTPAGVEPGGPIGARDTLFATEAVHVTFEPGPGTDRGAFTMIALPDGRYTVEQGDDLLVFNGRAHLQRAGGLCYLPARDVELPPVPGITTAQRVAEFGPLDSGEAVLTYQVPVGRGVSAVVVEHLGRYVDQGVLQVELTGGEGSREDGVFTVRPATGDEERLVEAETRAPVAQWAPVTLRRRALLPARGAMSIETLEVAVVRGCGVWPTDAAGVPTVPDGEWPPFETRIGGGTQHAVQNVVPIDVPIGAEPGALTAAIEAGRPTVIPLTNLGASFGVRHDDPPAPDEPWFAYEIAECEWREWFQCGPRPEQ